MRLMTMVCVGLMVVVPAAHATQAPGRTAWGDPDLQGVWQGFESIALERPLTLGDKQFFTDEEMAARIAKAKAQSDARSSLIGAGKVEHQGFRSVPNYNAIFEYSDSAAPPRMSNRTSAIIDPP